MANEAHDLTKADAIPFARLEARFEGHVERVDERLGKLEGHAVHADSCIDDMKIKIEQMYNALLLFRDPMAWARQNWVGIVFVGLIVALAMSGSTAAVAKGIEFFTRIFGA